MSKVLFITSGPITWGSSRMRAYWPAEHMEDAKVVTLADAQNGVDTADCGVIVWQKVFNTTIAADAKAKGIKQIYDACDPVWWFDPNSTREVMEYVDAATCSSSELQADLVSWMRENDFNHTRTYHIPDSIDLRLFPKKRQHQDANPVRLVWFGQFQNRIALFSAFSNLERACANGYNLELTIIDDNPQDQWDQLTKFFPVYHLRWDLERENDILSNFDIALLPPYPGPWGKVKSSNKSVTAWACGLPVSTGANYKALIYWLESAENRKNVPAIADYAIGTFTAETVAQEWEAVCASLS